MFKKNVPLRVVGLHYSYQDIQVVLWNRSKKVVTSFVVIGSFGGSHGCTVQSPENSGISGGQFTSSVVGHLEESQIAPNGKITTTNSPLSPSTFVYVANELRTINLLVRVMVTLVTFADGSEWRSSPVQAGLPFDTSDSEGDLKCQDKASRLEALSKVNKVGFRPEIKLESDGLRKEKESQPFLDYSCALEESEAVCPPP
jgi:hypothetical protein